MADIYGASIYSLYDRITMDWLTGGKVARTAASATLLFDRGDLLLVLNVSIRIREEYSREMEIVRRLKQNYRRKGKFDLNLFS